MTATTEFVVPKSIPIILAIVNSYDYFSYIKNQNVDIEPVKSAEADTYFVLILFIAIGVPMEGVIT